MSNVFINFGTSPGGTRTSSKSPGNLPSWLTNLP